ncbi:unnamed protein product [Oikopleura dioica]|uniref:Uncharacterized protein n=1 Tax=Oikopleura dioica TaxID=34765 RepID=E4WX29_OIKDI|nr:unnamed protein product [Oikopleura dioica]
MSTADSRAASDYELSAEDSDASASIASDEEDHSEDELRQLEDQQDDDLLEIYAKLYGHKVPEKQEINEEEKIKKEAENPEKKQKLEELEKIIDEKSITPDLPESPKDEKTENLNKITNTARSMLPTGLTLGENHVKTPIPSLMKGKLRDYQHIGLDWLVSLKNYSETTISLLAHLAVNQGQWGPHLVVVPTSVLLNWDLEFKKWFPGFKVIAYYGSQKERKEKRCGWSRENMFHCVITSYNLVIQDQRMFKRKDWNYLILDEAHNIKNWMSQRWQTLLGFKSEHRLLLTGTPLQNDLLELWALLHFLMPNLFESRKGFSEWFHRPIGDMVEGSVEYNKKLVERLHKVLRPFLLRRLKSEVEKQMPKKYEHVVYCHLSKRQRALYEDYICRTDTQERMKCGGYIGIIGVIMNLRKVCNHPDLLEPRPVESPFLLPRLSFSLPRTCQSILTHNHARGFTGRLWQRLPTTGYALDIRARTELSIFNTFTINKLDASKEYYNLYISEHQKYAKKKPAKGYEWLAFRRQQKNKSKYKTMYSTNRNRCSVLPAPSHFAPENVRQLLNVPMLQVIKNISIQKSLSPISNVLKRKISCYCSTAEAPVAKKETKSKAVKYKLKVGHVQRCALRWKVFWHIWVSVIYGVDAKTLHNPSLLEKRVRYIIFKSFKSSKCRSRRNEHSGSQVLFQSAMLSQLYLSRDRICGSISFYRDQKTFDAEIWVEFQFLRELEVIRPLRSTIDLVYNVFQSIEHVVFAVDRRSGFLGVCYDLINVVSVVNVSFFALVFVVGIVRLVFQVMDAFGVLLFEVVEFGFVGQESRTRIFDEEEEHLLGTSFWEEAFCGSVDKEEFWRVEVFDGFLVEVRVGEESLELFVEFVSIFSHQFCSVIASKYLSCEERDEVKVSFIVYLSSCWASTTECSPIRDISESTKSIRQKTHDEDLARRVQLPETRLIQYDCGKLQTLHDLIYQKLRPNGHRALIFTQMTKMLDVLERFLSYHALTYSRLDGSTAPEKRIQIMETFNRDPKIFCMILSTRSGGVGVNLTGADTVIFYDSDWNPTIDAQAQDRAHRIGQTRDVHIYRFIAKDTIEENILKKANYKRKLGNVAIEEGRFNIEGLKEDQLRVLIQGKEDDDSCEPSSEEQDSSENVKNNLAAVEDADDQEAAKVILDEVDEDEEEFQEESDDEIEDKLTPLEQKSLSWFLEDQARTIAEEEAQKAEETRIRKLKEEAKVKANQPVLPKEFQTNKRSKRIDKRLKHERAMENELKRCRRTDSDFYDDSDEEGYMPVQRKSYQTRTAKPPARRGRPPNSTKDKISEEPITISPKRKALPRDNSTLRLNKVEVQFVACNPRRLSSAQIPPSEPDW